MKRIVLATALIAGASVPAFADTIKAPGFANQKAAEIQAQLTLESDGFNEGLSAYVIDEATSPSNVSVSTRNVVNTRAAEIFAELEDAGDSNSGLSDLGYVTQFSGEVVNDRAAAIFELLDDED